LIFLLQAIGAVNTIIRRPSDGKLIGYNTDYVGAISAIEDGIAGHYNLLTLLHILYI
jgi:3-dehydroquinate dehydratase / shikimate dehydrogenase